MIKTQIGEFIPLEVIIVASNRNGNLEVGYRYIFEDEDDEAESITINKDSLKPNEAYVDPYCNKQIYDFLKVNGYLREVGYFSSVFRNVIKVTFTEKFFREVAAC